MYNYHFIHSIMLGALCISYMYIHTLCDELYYGGSRHSRWPTNKPIPNIGDNIFRILGITNVGKATN